MSHRFAAQADNALSAGTAHEFDCYFSSRTAAAAAAAMSVAVEESRRLL